MEQAKQKESFGQRWDQARAPKKVVFWAIIGAIVLTMIGGFNWGGWVTGGTAQKMTNDAVAQRLSLICVGQFNQDPGKEQKLNDLKEVRFYERGEYVKEQGWATMPGEAEPDSNVAGACAKLIIQISQ